MAMIDYGAVVFKNGKQINHELFMDMEDAVGWVDYPRLRYEDCDHLRLRKSACDECPRATRKHYSRPDLGEWDSVIADCRGAKIESIPGKLDGNFFAYIGDSHVTVCFYKRYFVVFLNGGKVDEVWPGDWRSIQREYDGAKVRVKRIADWVFHFSMKYNGDRYHVIYGYGIDPDKKVWDRVKVDYLGKNVSRKVDRLMGKLEVSEGE